MNDISVSYKSGFQTRIWQVVNTHILENGYCLHSQGLPKIVSQSYDKLSLDLVTVKKNYDEILY